MRPDLFLFNFAIFKPSIYIFLCFSLIFYLLIKFFILNLKGSLSLMKIAYKSPVHKVINFLKTAATIGRKNVAEPKYG